MAKVYAIRDRKSALFQKPFYERDSVMAIRAFQVMCENKESALNKWPADFELLHLGEFDESTGKFVLLEHAAVMAEPNQFLSQG